jgi:hypothetical protein
MAAERVVIRVLLGPHCKICDATKARRGYLDARIKRWYVWNVNKEDFAQVYANVRANVAGLEPSAQPTSVLTGRPGQGVKLRQQPLGSRDCVTGIWSDCISAAGLQGVVKTKVPAKVAKSLCMLTLFHA